MSQPTAQPATGTPYGTLPSASPLPQRKPVSLPRLQEMRDRGEKITMLTAYDATFARLVDEAGVDCILVGDSLGMIVQGHTSTRVMTPTIMSASVSSPARCTSSASNTQW